MNQAANAEHDAFDMTPYTRATLRFDMRIRFEGRSAADVFAIMGDPERITDWYLLAEEVRMLPPSENGDSNFDVVFVFFGQVHEEILHWDMPRRYVYKAAGKDFPIKDYVASIEISESGSGDGVMIWRQYFDEIEGAHNQRILPVILPPINEVSLKKLAPLIGGTDVSIESFF